MKDIKKVMIKVMKTQVPKMIKDNDERKMAFCRKMKMPNKGTEQKEGSPYGDIRYSNQEKFKP